MSNPAGWLSVCETGGCLEIQIQGDTVVLRETSTPDDEVVTTLASWQAWQDKARAEERAKIVAAFEAELANANQGRDWRRADHCQFGAAFVARGGFADVAANHD